MARRRRILIVEDDRHLGPRLEELVRSLDDFEAVRVQSREAGLAKLRDNGAGYDLVIVDIMLPTNQTALRDLRRLEADYDAAERKYYRLSEANRDGGKGVRLREDMQGLLAQARQASGYEAGITMLTEWLKELPENSRRPAIVYLTAKSEKSVRQKAEDLALHHGCPYAYLVKPQSTAYIRECILTLIEKVRKADGAKHGIS
jgi:CheY-like chemotaxis protein